MEQVSVPRRGQDGAALAASFADKIYFCRTMTHLAPLQEGKDASTLLALATTIVEITI